MRRGLSCALLAVVVTVLAGCGGGSEKKGETEQPSVAAKAACSGAALADTSKLQLPPSWPQIEADKMTYTKQEKSGPTVVIEGYFNGDVKEAHDEWKKELGIPKNMNTFAVIPIGWPRGKFGPVSRRPAAEAIHRERW